MDQLFNILEDAQNVIGQGPSSFACDNSVIQPISPIPAYTTFQDLTPLALPRASSSKQNSKAQKKRTWKKPKDKPKRPLSAYNLFFQQERSRIIASIPDSESTAIDDGIPEEVKRKKHRKTHGKIGFADLARSIADKWKCIDASEREIFEQQAETEKLRYKEELEAWTKAKKESGELVKKKKKSIKKHPSPPAVSPPPRLVPPCQSTAADSCANYHNNNNNNNGQAETLAQLLVKGSSYRYQMLQQMTNAFLQQQQQQQQMRQQIFQQQQHHAPQFQGNEEPLRLDLPDETFSSDTFFEEVHNEQEQDDPPLGDDFSRLIHDFDGDRVVM